jgi:hypothetical protein
MNIMFCWLSNETGTPLSFGLWSRPQVCGRPQICGCIHKTSTNLWMRPQVCGCASKQLFLTGLSLLRYQKLWRLSGTGQDYRPFNGHMAEVPDRVNPTNLQVMSRCKARHPCQQPGREGRRNHNGILKTTNRETRLTRRFSTNLKAIQQISTPFNKPQRHASTNVPPSNVPLFQRRVESKEMTAE